jgi:hypothetical protein
MKDETTKSHTTANTANVGREAAISQNEKESEHAAAIINQRSAGAAATANDKAKEREASEAAVRATEAKKAMNYSTLNERI